MRTREQVRRESGITESPRLLPPGVAGDQDNPTDRSAELLLLVLLGGLVAGLANFALFLGFNAALVFALFAFLLGFVAARLGAHDGNAAKHEQGGDDSGDGLHFWLVFLVRGFARDDFVLF